MSFTRIDITNTSSYGRYYGIDRTMPAIMNGRMSEQEWDLFCIQVDKHIVPLNKLRYLLIGGIVVLFAGFIVVMIVAVSRIPSYVNHSMNDFDDSSWSTNPFTLFLIPLGLMMGFIILTCYFSCVASRAFNKVRQVCEATSRDNSQVSFHLRDDRLVVGGNYTGSGSYNRTYHNTYIEASLSDVNVVPTITSAQISRVDFVPMSDLEAGYSKYTPSGTNIPLAHATHVPYVNDRSSNVTPK